MTYTGRVSETSTRDDTRLAAVEDKQGRARGDIVSGDTALDGFVSCPRINVSALERA